jgi:hypothetical protein
VAVPTPVHTRLDDVVKVWIRFAPLVVIVPPVQSSTPPALASSKGINVPGMFADACVISRNVGIRSDMIAANTAARKRFITGSGRLS